MSGPRTENNSEPVKNASAKEVKAAIKLSVNGIMDAVNGLPKEQKVAVLKGVINELENKTKVALQHNAELAHGGPAQQPVQEKTPGKKLGG